mmetsp:Transcript_18349/g.19115  ORF Transcript_18349/g.19115 Transcript_18349/m.19115 type:complete len:108 (+) Transcript_18349:43-366(+)
MNKLVQRLVSSPLGKVSHSVDLNKLKKFGLLEQDILFLTPAIQKAIDRLPAEYAIARERRLYRAADLSLKKKELPAELQIDPKENYFGDLIDLAQQEIDERNELNHY